MNEYRFDLRKAVETEHAHYFMRLALGLNALLSVQQLMDLNGRAEQPEHVRKGVLGYLCAMHVSHLVETYIAFVEKITPTPPHLVLKYQGLRKKGKKTPPVVTSELYDFIKSNDSIKESFEQLEANLKDKRFPMLRQFRNTFGFHFNHEANGKKTVEAVRSILADEKDGDHPDNGLIVMGTPLESRFVFADQVLISGWFNAAGATSPKDEENASIMAVHQEFIMQATKPMIRFGQDAFLDWVRANKLQVP